MSIIKSGILVVFNGLLQRSIPIILSLLVSIYTGESAFAEFTFILVTANTISAVCAMGIAPAILSSLSETYYKNRENLNKDVTHICIFILIFAGITYSISIFFQVFTSDIAFSKNIFTLSKLASGILLIQAMQSVLYASKKYLIVTYFSIFQFFSSLVICYFILISNTPENISYVYSTIVITIGISALIYGFIISSNKNFNNFSNFNISIFNQILKKQLPYTGYTLIWMVAVYGCTLIVAKKYSVLDLAIYNLGYQWYSLVLIIPALLSGILIPHFVKNMNGSSNNNDITKITIIYTVIACILMAILFISSSLIIKLYKFEPTELNQNVFLVMTAAGCLIAISTPIMQKLLADRSFKKLYCISGIWTIIGLICNWYFSNSVLEVSQWFLAASSAVFVFAFILLLNDLRNKKVSI